MPRSIEQPLEGKEVKNRNEIFAEFEDLPGRSVEKT